MENSGMLLGVMGLSTVELVKLWQSVAPSMQEVRAAPENDAATMQRIMDANYLGAGLALLVGGTTSVLVQSWFPLIMALGSVVLVAHWHMMVLNSSNFMMQRNDDE